MHTAKGLTVVEQDPPVRRVDRGDRRGPGLTKALAQGQIHGGSPRKGVLAQRAKIRAVEGEDMHDALSGHRCNEPSVVGLLPGNAVRHHKSSPFRVNVVGVGKPNHGTLDAPHDTISLARSDAEPIVFEWPRADSPEFDKILRSDADAISVFAEPGYGVTSPAVLRVGTMKAAKDDIGIGKNRPLTVPVILARIDALPAHRLVRKWRYALRDKIRRLLERSINFFGGALLRASLRRRVVQVFFYNLTNRNTFRFSFRDEARFEVRGEF